ncbi:hypothetical protein Cri9333_2910 [Crinalium epipsammum PCC 9333]|uniref:DUF4327 family protein n=1 Tax=Crinalium epipsammum PCC 9333 TaxID=1173022 RepID=K9W1S4_9CYAN|nr:DUF4327 family protein [Crinalium epipsammum]AFZ13749.1 hypothetical protein Cri9333_2910 [Crinalium epipsammum PCC 9333]
MSINTIQATNSLRYSIEVIKDEARQLVDKGVISRQQPIYVLCQYIPAREWVCVECELERCNFLLRDRVGDLMGHEEWEND